MTRLRRSHAADHRSAPAADVAAQSALQPNVAAPDAPILQQAAGNELGAVDTDGKA